MPYLLTCSCGRKHVVEPQRAGQQIDCECGVTLAIPKLRELRKLPPAEKSSSASAEWSTEQGVVFGIGFVLLLIALAAIGYSIYLLSGLDTARPEIDDSRAEQALARLDPVESLNVWESYTTHGLRRAGPPDYLLARRFERVLLITIAGACGALLLAFGLIGYSVLRRRSPGS